MGTERKMSVSEQEVQRTLGRIYGGLDALCNLDKVPKGAIEGIIIDVDALARIIETGTARI